MCEINQNAKHTFINTDNYSFENETYFDQHLFNDILDKQLEKNNK